MASLIPTSFFDLVDAPALTRIQVGQHWYVKEAPLAARPWRREGQTKWLGSQLVWERWRRAHQQPPFEEP